MSYMFNVKKQAPTSFPEEDLSIFEAKKQPIPGSKLQQEENPQEEKGFTQRAFEMMQESEQEERELERHRARGMLRIGERIVGLPGDVASLIRHISGGGEEFPLPTSSQLKEKSEGFFGDYVTAQTPIEEKTDEYLGDVASMMVSPIPGLGTAANLTRIIGVPLVGSLVKEGVRYTTGDEKKAAYAKMAVELGLDLVFARGGGPQKHISELFQEVERLAPQGTRTSGILLQQSINDTRSLLEKGGKRTSTSKALSIIDEIESKIQNGQVDVSELPAFRRTINEAIEELGGWSAEIPKPVRERAIENLNEVKRNIIEAGEDYGRNHNPDFLKAWKDANESAAAFAKSNVISNYIKNNFGDRYLSKGAKLLFAGAGITGGKLAPTATAIATPFIASTALIYESAKIIYRVMKSETLKKYYSDVVKHALDGNKAEMVSSMQKLDAEMAKEEKQREKRIKQLSAS